MQTSYVTASPPRLFSEPPVSILQILDSFRCGGFFLDLRGHVVSLNLMAFACLGDGIVLGGGQLSATDRATNGRLRSLVCSGLDPIFDSKASTAIAIQRESRLPLAVRAVRLDEGAEPSFSAVRLLLITVDPEMRQEPSKEILKQAFDLTPAEADVAIGISSGKTLTEIALDRKVKVGTVRTHCKTVFLKTHTRSQADLTGVLSRLAFAVPKNDLGYNGRI